MSDANIFLVIAVVALAMAGIVHFVHFSPKIHLRKWGEWREESGTGSMNFGMYIGPVVANVRYCDHDGCNEKQVRNMQRAD